MNDILELEARGSGILLINMIAIDNSNELCPSKDRAALGLPQINIWRSLYI